MSSVLQAARVGSTAHSGELLGGWASLVFILVGIHVAALFLWIILCATQSLRGTPSIAKEDKQE